MTTKSKHAKHWENAVSSTILADKSMARDLSEQDLAIALCADEIDEIERRLVAHSLDLSQRFAAYAEYIEAGRAATVPMGHVDIERDAALRDAKVDQLFTLVRITCGKGAIDALRKAVSASRKGGA